MPAWPACGPQTLTERYSTPLWGGAEKTEVASEGALRGAPKRTMELSRSWFGSCF